MNKEKLTRKIIEAIHGLPYEEAIREEMFKCGEVRYRQSRSLKPFLLLSTNGDKNEAFILDKKAGVVKTTFNYICDCECVGLPVTIGRVMQSIRYKVSTNWNIGYSDDYFQIKMTDKNNEIISWKLIQKNGQEATLDDQSEETINRLLELFN